MEIRIGTFDLVILILIGCVFGWKAALVALGVGFLLSAVLGD